MSKRRYGPYRHPMGYIFFIDYDKVMKRHSTVRAHREVMEGVLRRKLSPQEVVHHKNDQKDDNRPENLEVMTASEHSIFHAYGGRDVADGMRGVVEIECLVCGGHFKRHASKERMRLKRGRLGPCCSKACVGRLTAMLREGGEVMDDSSRRAHFYLRFMRKVSKQNDGCWLWAGAVGSKDRVGVVTFKGKRYSAHRVSWEFKHGSIPQGVMIQRTCGERLCVNPEHMEMVER